MPEISQETLNTYHTNIQELSLRVQRSIDRMDATKVYGWHFHFNNGVKFFTTDRIEAENIVKQLALDEKCVTVFTIDGLS